MKVLIAEDCPGEQTLLERALEGMGYEAIIARDGVEALEVLRRDSQIHLAILDWMMPRMDGLEACREIQKLGRFVYAILLTGAGDLDDLTRALEEGASDYLVKPVEPMHLNARLLAGARIVDLQIQMSHMQKLESVGRLASGIAHEINTPIQYVGDNVLFLKESFEQLTGLLMQIEDLFEKHGAEVPDSPVFRDLAKAVEEVDLGYICEEIPSSIAQSQEGLQRVAKIVSSMKEFSHPSTDTKQPVDLARAIETTITVAKNEWKYVAEVVTDFDPELLPVECLAGEINQTILVLIVNASQAIAETVSEGQEKGKILVSTRRSGDFAEIRVQDSGAGIPEEIRSKIFEPFFTTKAVGLGTGQGLAIARAAVVDKHGGSISVESEAGRGSTFTIRLPIVPELPPKAAGESSEQGEGS